ncbi:MAG: helix-turn-helix domain-containing protein [Sarcina sp.]
MIEAFGKYNLIYPLENNFLETSTYKLKENTKDTILTRENIILLVVTQGNLKIKIGKSKLYQAPFELLILPAYAKLNYEVTQDTNFLIIKLNKKLIQRLSNEISSKTSTSNQNTATCRNFIYIKSIDSELQNSYKKAFNYIKNHKKNDSLANIYSLEFIGKLLHIQGVEALANTSLEPIIDEALNLMKRNVFSKLTIQEIALDIDLSLSNFSLKFKNIMGISPNEYFRKLKMKEALVLIKYKSVSKVAHDLGYNNTSYFIRLFTEFYGITPKQYLLQHKNKAMAH